LGLKLYPTYKIPITFVFFCFVWAKYLLPKTCTTLWYPHGTHFFLLGTLLTTTCLTVSSSFSGGGSMSGHCVAWTMVVATCNSWSSSSRDKSLVAMQNIHRSFTVETHSSTVVLVSFLFWLIHCAAHKTFFLHFWLSLSSTSSQSSKADWEYNKKNKKRESTHSSSKGFPFSKDFSFSR